MKHEQFDRFVSVIVLGIAVASFALIARRSFSTPAVSGDMTRQARKIDNWSVKAKNVVRPVGGELRAPVVLTVFTDFECPFCRQLDSLVIEYSHKNPGAVRLQIVHMPLSIHMNAKLAAHAFECGVQQDRANSVVHSLYRHQDVLGQIPWDSVAVSAGVPSIESFRACMLDSIPPEIELGKRLAKDLDLSVTPTVVVNDWLLSPAEPEYIFRSIEAVAAGRNPKP